MKREKAIRDAIADLKTLADSMCPNGPFCLGCLIFKAKALDGLIPVLEWVLEENDDLDRKWEEMAAHATKVRAK
jgi:hypothetical protein